MSTEPLERPASSPSPNERLGAHLFDLSPFPGVVSRLSDQTILAIHARTAEIFGIPQSEAPGLKVTDYYVDASERQRMIEQLRRDGRIENFRIQLRRPDSTTFWAQASARQVTYEGESAVLSLFT